MKYTDKDIKEAMAFIKDRVNAEISMQTHLDDALLAAAKEIAQIAYRYKIKASLFRFSANQELHREVNNVIAKLRQRLYEYIETLALSVDKEQKDELLLYINRETYGKTLKERINTYTNRFKYEIEAFIAAALLSKLSVEKLIASIRQDLEAPYNNNLFKKGVQLGGMATRLRTGGVSYGNGHSNSSRNLLKSLSRNTIASAWMFMYGEIAKSKGAIGFFSFRGSSYPCAHCDDMTGYHPIEEYRGMWHPNCRCFFVFAYN